MRVMNVHNTHMCQCSICVVFAHLLFVCFHFYSFFVSAAFFCRILVTSLLFFSSSYFADAIVDVCVALPYTLAHIYTIWWLCVCFYQDPKKKCGAAFYSFHCRPCRHQLGECVRVEGAGGFPQIYNIIYWSWYYSNVSFDRHHLCYSCSSNSNPNRARVKQLRAVLLRWDNTYETEYNLQ